MESTDNKMSTKPYYSKLISHLPSELSIEADLDVEMNQIPLRLTATSGSAVISFTGLMDAYHALRNLKRGMHISKDTLNQINDKMAEMELTIYLQNQHFGILGQKSSAVYRRLFTSLLCS
jgi:hypothetical protein